MPTNYEELEHHIQDALDAIGDGEYRFATDAAVAFNVKVRTLQRRIAGSHTSFFEREPHGHALTDDQRGAIVIYLTRLDKLSISARIRHLPGAANYLLAQANPVDPSRVGQHWPARFLVQHPQFHRRKQTLLQSKGRLPLQTMLQRLTSMNFVKFVTRRGSDPKIFGTWTSQAFG